MIELLIADVDGTLVTTPIAGFNGGMFVKPDMTPIDLKTLPEGLVEPVLRAIGDHRLDAWVYQGSDWFVRDAAALERTRWLCRGGRALRAAPAAPLMSLPLDPERDPPAWRTNHRRNPYRPAPEVR